MKKSIYLTRLSILFFSLILTQTAFADVKIKARQTVSGQTSENTTYIKGKRQRTEMMDGQMVSITQCDLRRSIQLNGQSKTYIVNLFNEPDTNTEKPSKSVSGAQTSVEKSRTVTTTEKGGTVTMTVTNKDTGLSNGEKRRRLSGQISIQNPGRAK
ncbi:MAG: hypothetical protein LC768_09900 [Acidobacteria bacterium]|nr:hypothetical protein [Acidobacteriota bacterium]